MHSLRSTVGVVITGLLLLTALPACDESGEGPAETGADSGAVETTDGESTEAGTEADTDTDTDGDTDGTADDSTGAETDESPPSSVPGRDCPPDAFVDAQNFGMPFMTTWCAACHSAQLTGDERGGAPEGIDLDTLEGVKDNLLLVFAWAADEHDMMPPAGGPTAEERILLGDWLACGAP